MIKSTVRESKPLTPQETRVLRLSLKGLALDQIGVMMGIKRDSVKHHIDTINRRLPTHCKGNSKRVMYGALALRWRVVTVEELIDALKNVR